jgi:hypothetical protein
MTTVFEVGKKYTLRTVQVEVECVYVTPATSITLSKIAIVRFQDGKELSVHLINWDRWIEVVTTQKEKFSVVSHNKSGIHCTQVLAGLSGYDIHGSFEVSIQNGKLVGLEIVK